MDKYVVKKSQTLQSLYVSEMSRNQFSIKSGISSVNFAKVENFTSPLSFKNAQRLSEASEKSIRDIFLSHMAEDLVHQHEEGNEILALKRIAWYAEELAKPECSFTVAEKRHLLSVLKKLIDPPGWSEHQREQQDKLRQQEREDDLKRQERERREHRDSFGRKRPIPNLERDQFGRRRR
mgnify:CR=1 FL=1